VANGVPAYHVVTVAASVENLYALNGTLDCIYSVTSYGFHSPVSTYAAAALAALKPGGMMLLNVRANSKKTYVDNNRAKSASNLGSSQLSQAVEAGFECTLPEVQILLCKKLRSARGGAS
jgi:hypothetical protein